VSSRSTEQESSLPEYQTFETNIEVAAKQTSNIKTTLVKGGAQEGDSLQTGQQPR
jgi:hypothetical protein